MTSDAILDQFEKPCGIRLSRAGTRRHDHQPLSFGRQNDALVRNRGSSNPGGVMRVHLLLPDQLAANRIERVEPPRLIPKEQQIVCNEQG